MMFKIWLALILSCFSIPAFAVGTTIVTALAIATTYGATAAAVAAFAINMIVATIITKVISNTASSDFGIGSGESPNPGNRQQLAPATDNKLPVVYGTAYVGGVVTDLTISSNNQILYYVISLCEVTGGGTDNITFGDVYYGGKKVLFNPENGSQVRALLDESTGTEQAINNSMLIYFYKNGSYQPTNGPDAITAMSQPDFIYKWDNSKLMTNCAFAIIGLEYNQTLGITGLSQTKFQITNSRSDVADCFYDYLTNDVYGCAIPAAQVDEPSLLALSAYSNQLFTYTNYSGGTSTQQRFRFNGALDTSRTVMQNLQDMATCCDCLIKYNEVTAKWGVIVQSPTYTSAMNINDSNMISAIQITPLDISSSYNVIECKFPDVTAQDSFNSATFDLAEIAPSLLYPNEPVNKVSLSLPLTNNSVTAQYIANRVLKAGREDLQVQVSVNFVGIQLDAGDVVTVTNSNYGWVEKPFRINKVVQQFNDDGSIAVQLNMSEYNASVYDDVSVTQFTPAPNTGIGSPLGFGTLYAPTIVATYPNAAMPSILLGCVTASSGITQYIEIWYSAYSSPTESQRIFYGTSQIQSNGNPYNVNTTVPNISIEGLPAGNWYFFARMVNSFGSSNFSNASSVVNWRPTTFQYTDRYVVVAYADSITGTGFSLNPRNKTYYGLLNKPSANPSIVPSDYSWYLAPVPFGATTSDNFVLFANRTNRKFSFSVGNASYIGLGGAFIPTETSVYDQTVWSGLEDNDNVIDLDERTGQITKVGTTSVSSADGLVSVSNNTSGTMVVSLQKFLNFGNGVYSKTVAPAKLTVDVYGRVVGFIEEDDFYYTENIISATAGQTSFSDVHIVGQCLVFRNGSLLSVNDYTETSTTVVMNNACATGEIIVIISMRVVSKADFYAPLVITIASSTTNTITYNGIPYQSIVVGDKLAFSDGGATYTVSGINPTTKIITFSTTISGATAGNQVFEFRAAGASYPPFTRYEQDVTNISSFTPTAFSINNGFEQIFVNGSAFNEVDYDISGNTVGSFPSNITGKLILIMYEANNLGVPCSNITNTVAYSVSGSLTYVFASNPLSMAVYANGSYLIKGSSYDYVASAVSYNLVVAYTNNSTLLNQQTFSRIGAA